MTLEFLDRISRLIDRIGLILRILRRGFGNTGVMAFSRSLAAAQMVADRPPCCFLQGKRCAVLELRQL